MKMLDLFSGIGGFALAAKWIWQEDLEIKAFCEIDKYCQKVLQKNFPGVPIYDDIKKLKGKEIGTVKLVTGGFPCQPFSIAGKRKGKEDDRYLWPEMFRVIQETRPNWVVAENVTGIINMELDKTLSDLESENYETETFIIPACATDAPHRRDRIWIIANANSKRQSRQEKSGNKFYRFEILGLQKFDNITSESLRKINGISEKLDKDRLKSLGNAIVPQVAQRIFWAIKEIENNE
jgi:DNA (cytosine-5)-methyltransferase 1